LRKAAFALGLEGRTAVIIGLQPLWLEALGELLARSGMKVLDSAAALDAGVELVGQHKPEILLIDGDGAAEAEVIALIGRAKALDPQVSVLVLSSLREVRAISNVLRAGAAAFCLKAAASADLTAAVRQSLNQSFYLAAGSLSESSGRVGSAAFEGDDEAADLTKRELEILRLVAEGHSNSQLARMLWVTEQTVKFHLSNVYRKLDVANRTEASRWAQRHGLLSPERGSSERPQSPVGC
jgi:DNA-binding NarL/FixJ family response regulator